MHKQTNRAFGLTVSVILSAFGALNWWLSNSMMVPVGVAAGFFLSTALLWPEVLLPLNWLWTRLSGHIAAANNYVILGASFYCIIWPTGIVVRLFGRDLLVRCFDAETESYFMPVARQADAETFPDLF